MPTASPSASRIGRWRMRRGFISWRGFSMDVARVQQVARVGMKWARRARPLAGLARSVYASQSANCKLFLRKRSNFAGLADVEGSRMARPGRPDHPGDWHSAARGEAGPLFAPPSVHYDEGMSDDFS